MPSKVENLTLLNGFLNGSCMQVVLENKKNKNKKRNLLFLAIVMNSQRRRKMFRKNVLQINFLLLLKLENSKLGLDSS